MRRILTFSIFILYIFYKVNSNNNVVAPTFARVPFYESFENEWINKDDIRDVPSLFWKNSPSTGFNSWSREDDGVQRGAWISNNGFNLPSGANNTKHSARFHSYDAPKGSNGTLDLYIDFSTIDEKKYLSFWYINRSGEDSLKVYTFPLNSGTPGPPLISLGIATTWRRITIDLGNIKTQNIIRFLAISDRGYSDIQIDEVIVSNFIADFKADVTCGNAPLTVNFGDLSYYNPTTWLWDFDNDGNIDSKKQNPSWTYTEPGFYNVMLKAMKKDVVDSIIKKNYIQVNYFAKLPFYEGFENEWIDRDALRDVPSIYWKNLPPSGNNSWSREDDGINRAAWDLSKNTFSPSGAQNTLHCAKFNTLYTLPDLTGELILYINFATMPAGKTLTFWYINPDGRDSLFIHFSEDSGKNFKEILKLGISEKWQKYAIDLGNVYTSMGIIKFIAKSDWGYTDIGIDEINIGGLYAKFTCSDTIGSAPLTVYFNNLSYGSPDVVKWDFNNDNIIDSYEYNPTYTFNEEGIYFVKLIIEKDKEIDSIIKKIEVKNSTTLNETSSNYKINIYPIPAKERIFIKNENNENIKLIEIYDINGNLIHIIKRNPEYIDLTDLKDGVYLLKIMTEKSIYNFKILKF